VEVVALSFLSILTQQTHDAGIPVMAFSNLKDGDDLPAEPS
jgi:hypothetical protein